jgi:hypothetical protein
MKNRRTFLKSLGTMGAALTLGTPNAAHAAAPPSRYRTLYVGPVTPGDPNGRSVLRGMNDAGECVGSYYDPATDNGGGFYFQLNADRTGGTFVDLETLLPPGLPFPGLTLQDNELSINNSGVIAGVALWRPNGPDEPAEGLLYRLHPPNFPGGPREFESCAAGGWLVRIGDSGDVVFYAGVGAPGNHHAFLWLRGAAGPIDLGNAYPGTSIQPVDCVRFRGTVMIAATASDNGGAGTVPGFAQPYRIEYDLATGATNYRWLGGFAPVPNHGYAVAVDEAGNVVGSTNAVNEEVALRERAFLWRPAIGLIPLGTFGGEDSWPTSINNEHLIVGHAEYASDPTVAPPFLYKDRQIWDLTPFIDGTLPSWLADSNVGLKVNKRGIIGGPYMGFPPNYQAAPGPANGDTVCLLVPTNGEGPQGASTLGPSPRF